MSKSCTLKGADKVFRLHLNRVASCCRAQDEKLDIKNSINDYIAQWQHQRDQLDQGIEIAGCENCWNDENNGRVSFRQQHKEIEFGNTIEIFVSNACNHMCSYCSPKFSSEWAKTIQTQGMFSKISTATKKNLEIVDQNNTDDQYWLTQIVEYVNCCEDNSINITLLGGEPLMQLRVLELLQKFDLKKIKLINLATNLNPPSEKFLHWLVNTVSADKLFFSVSLDSTPEYNHVPRAGFDQNKFYQNLELIRQKNISFKLVSVLSVLSLFDLPKFICWTDEQKIPVQFLNIHNPECLNPGYVPAYFKNQLLINKTAIPDSVQNIFSVDSVDSLVDLKLFEQYNYLTQYFERTNTDLTNINNPLFQEYWQWLTKRFKNETSTSQ